MNQQTMNYFKHEHALVETAFVGDRTHVWAFAHILPGARVGDDCNICDHTFIENDVIIGNRVTLKNGVQVWNGVTLEDDVFVGPNVTFTNVLRPRSRCYPDRFDRTVVRKGASIGANATVLANNEIGHNALIGAGTVVTKSVPPNAIVMGNPGRIKGFVGPDDKEELEPLAISSGVKPTLTVTGVKSLPIRAGDAILSTGFSPLSLRDLPFNPKDWYLEFDASAHEVRGQYALPDSAQVLLCLTGRCSVVVDDGEARDELVLTSSDTGLYLPPMVWVTHYRFAPGTVLLTLLSGEVKQQIVTRYDQFLAARSGP